MKKPYDFKAKSPTDKCTINSEPLKANVVARAVHARACYKCWCKITDRNPRARKDNKLRGTRRIDRIDA